MTIEMMLPWVEKGGVPAVMLIVLWGICRFFKPHVEKLIPIFFELLRGHISLMGALEKTLGANTEKLEKVSSTQDDHGLLLKDIQKNVAT